MSRGRGGVEEEGDMARPLLLLVAGGEAPGGEAAAHTAGHPGSGAGQHAEDGDWDEAAGDDVRGVSVRWRL